jgi:ADP-ribose pyrophosphatase YjhB (NUDIX family)
MDKLVKGRQVLLVGNDFGDGTLHWEFPGGNLQRGEAFEEAVVRKVLEETGLIVRAVRLRYITEHIGSSNYWIAEAKSGRRGGSRNGSQFGISLELIL